MLGHPIRKIVGQPLGFPDSSAQPTITYAEYVLGLAPLWWLPLRETSGSITRNQMYSGGVGPEILTNGDFSAWTADDPDGWTVTGESGSDPEVSEVGSGEGRGGSGSGSANLYSSASFGAPSISQFSIITIGDSYRLESVISAVVAGGLQARVTGGGTQNFTVHTTPGTKIQDFIALGNSLTYRNGASPPCDATLDLVSLQKTGELDALIAGTTTLGQTGLLGVNEAFLLDGATSLLTITNRASIQGLAEFSLWALFNPSSAGEGDAGTLFSKASEFSLRYNSASGDLIATVNYGTTNAVTVTSSTLSNSAWHSVGLRIDDSSKTIEIFIDGVEASYASQTAGVGSRVSNTNNLIVGNNVGVTATLAGLIDEALHVNRILTDVEFAQLDALARAS